MQSLILVIHVLACFILVGVILLQAGKGAGMGASFGGGANTLFGARGPATFFQKFTTIVALIFLTTSMSLARYAKAGHEGSVIDTVPVPALAPAPVEEAPKVDDGGTQEKPVEEKTVQ